MNTLIISPTYNESKNIANLIEHVFTLDENYHLLIVDDNSPDGTENYSNAIKICIWKNALEKPDLAQRINLGLNGL